MQLPRISTTMSDGGYDKPTLTTGMGCSGRSLMSMNLGLRSEDFAIGGAVDAILDAIVDSDDEDDHFGGANGIDDGNIDDDGDDFGLQPIQSSDFVAKVLLAEQETLIASAPMIGTQPPKSRPQDDERELHVMANMTAQLGRMSTGTLLREIMKDNLNHLSSSDWAENLSIDAHGMGEMDPSIFDSSNGYSPSHQSPMSRHPEEYASVDQSNPHTPDTNVVSKPPAKSKRKIDESRVIVPTDDDVLLGRGGHTNIHPGNIRFREKALELRPWYERVSKEEKYHVSLVLIESVKSKGHRFLEKGSDGEWHEVLGNGARKKASQALRERLEGKIKVEKTSTIGGG